ncbi:MAG TPA: response regulator [Acidimicrobiales bacterium]|nr:response regulator [Acidimicrobiales bacterium]
MVVDDDPSWREWMQFHLSRNGWETLCAESAAAALPLVAEHEPDVVVLDENMPGDSGSKLASTLRQRGYAGRMMLLSASTDASLYRRCSSLSVQCVSKLAQGSLFAILAAWKAELSAAHPPVVIDLTGDPAEADAGRLRRFLRISR